MSDNQYPNCKLRNSHVLELCNCEFTLSLQKSKRGVFPENNLFALSFVNNLFNVILLVFFLLTTGCNPNTSVPIIMISPATTITFSREIIQPSSSYKSPTVTNIASFTNTASATFTQSLIFTASNISKWNVQLKYDYQETNNPNSFLDLDEKKVIENSQSDIQFMVRGRATLYGGLLPINGARLKSMGDEEIFLNDCISKASLLTKNATTDIYLGNHFCVISNNNRYYLLQDIAGSNTTSGITTVTFTIYSYE